MTTTRIPQLRRALVRSAVVAAAAASLAVPMACSSSPSGSGSGAVQPSNGGPAPGEQAGSQGAANAPVPDACKLLAPDDLTPLFGQPGGTPEAGLNTTGADESFCDYSPATHELGKVTLLQVQVFNSTRYLPRSGYTTDNPVDATVKGATEAFTAALTVTV